MKSPEFLAVANRPTSKTEAHFQLKDMPLNSPAHRIITLLSFSFFLFGFLLIRVNAQNDTVISGVVTDKQGNGIEGARVFINTAGVRTGTNPFCPSCYADCKKSAVTDSKGRFQLEKLDPQLLFNLLIVSEGYEPTFSNKVDPYKEPVSVTLKTFSRPGLTEDRFIRGKVVDSFGEPIVGATISPEGIHIGSGARYGRLREVDALVVSNERGEFMITSETAFDALSVGVEASGFSKRKFRELRRGETHVLTMTTGGVVTGRVLVDGKPLGNVALGLVSKDRTVDAFTGEFVIGTTDDGRFAFTNIPPETEYYVYGLMDSLRPYGSVGIQSVSVGKDDSVAEVGDLVVESAYRLKGRVVLADNGQVPAETRLLASRDRAWDSTHQIVSEDGRFEITGLPPETVRLNIRIPGYHLAVDNPNLESINQSIVGKIDRSHDNFMIHLVRGDAPRPDFQSGMLHTSVQARDRNLTGWTPENAYAFRLNGKLRDSESGLPISNFRITPGWLQNGRNQPGWAPIRSFDSRKGDFSLLIRKYEGDFRLRLEADGYLPAILDHLDPVNSSRELSLTPGQGYKGLVLNPDGSPAMGCRVIQMVSERNYQLSADPWKKPEWSKNNFFTDSDGKFSLPPELNIKRLVVAGEKGFAEIVPGSSQTELKVQLKPYGTVTGVLTENGKPASGSQLNLSYSHVHGRDVGYLNLQYGTLTDEQGEFRFDHVIPGDLKIYFREKANIKEAPGAYVHRDLSVVTVRPGENTRVAVQKEDRVRVERKESLLGRLLKGITGKN